MCVDIEDDNKACGINPLICLNHDAEKSVFVTVKSLLSLTFLGVGLICITCVSMVSIKWV